MARPRAATGSRCPCCSSTAHDYVCETLVSALAQPMRQHCDLLTEITVPSGHWMAQERPAEVNAGLAKWLATEVGQTRPA